MRTLNKILLQLLVLLFGSVAGLLGQSAPANRVEAVGFTVSDMDRSTDFYTRVLHFQKLSDVERTGAAIEHLNDHRLKAGGFDCDWKSPACG